MALEDYEPWRNEGDGLADEARALLSDDGADGRHLSSMDGVRPGIESSLEKIEKSRPQGNLKHSAGVGGTGPRGGRDRRSRNPPVRLCRSGGTRRAAGGIGRTGRRPIRDDQGMAGDRRPPDRTGHPHFFASEGSGRGAREDGSGCRVESGRAPKIPGESWIAKSKDIINECREMLEPDSIHAPHLDAMAGRGRGSGRPRTGSTGPCWMRTSPCSTDWSGPCRTGRH